MEEKIANQFTGLDMHSLIAGPLIAACEAERMLAAATAKFIEDVGLEELTDAQGDRSEGRKVRTTEFSFDRPVRGENGENIGQETVVMSVPLLPIIKIPTFGIDEMDITFDMEVKSSDPTLESSESSDDKNLRVDGNVNLGVGPFKAQVNIKRSIACHEKSTRTSENSAKYHVDLLAKDYGTPEGIARMLDIIAETCSPRVATTTEDEAKE